MSFWWVNHKQTFRQEFGGGYVWCPKRKQNGALNHFYETVRQVRPGDVVLSYADAAVQGFGFVQTHCYSCPRPDDFGQVGDAWDERGWRVDVLFQKLPNPLRTADHAQLIAPLLPARYSPIRANGMGNQGAYFAGVSRGLALLILQLADSTAHRLVAGHTVAEGGEQIDEGLPVITEWEDRQQIGIEHSLDLPETTRQALIQARRGQGRFRKRVAHYEYACRVTKVDNPAHLIASHIKPWRESDNDERLAPGNGLLLTPSIDHLFDRGFISFTDEGELITSPVADKTSLKRMGVDAEDSIHVGSFNSDQKHFLEHHRQEILLKSAS